MRERPWLTRCTGGLVAGAVLLAPAIAQASGPVHIDVAAGTTCGDARIVEARAAARGVRVSRAQDEAILATVSVTAKDAGMEGTLVVSRAGGRMTRVVTATTCDEVLDALAFTLALSLEDDRGEPVTPPRAVPPAPPPPPPVEEGEPSAHASPPAVEMPPAAGVPVAHGLALGVGAGAGMLRAALLSPSLGGWAMIGSRHTSWLSPAAFGGVALTLPTESTAGARRATFALQAALVDLCPLRVGSATLAVRPCARALFGRSQVRSEGFSGARLDDRVFGVAGVVLRGEGQIAGPLFVHLEVGAGVPLERTTYFIGNSRLFETPAVVVAAGLGVGVHFP